MVRPSNDGNVSVDVAVARREFLLALARCAPFAFAELSARARGDGHSSEAIADDWVRFLFAADVPWLRDWARRAANVLGLDQLAQQEGKGFIVGETTFPITDSQLLFFKILDNYAFPLSIVDSAYSDAGEHAYELMMRWQKNEWPPDGGFGEPKKEFMARMDRAFEIRKAALIEAGALPTHKRLIRIHAEWTVRRYICRHSVKDILAGPSNRPRGPSRNVELRVKEFAALVGLPPNLPRVHRPRRPTKRT